MSETRLESPQGCDSKFAAFIAKGGGLWHSHGHMFKAKNILCREQWKSHIEGTLHTAGVAEGPLKNTECCGKNQVLVVI